MLRLPDDKGFVELVNEPEVEDRRKPNPTAIVAYFLAGDARSPLDAKPTDVTFTPGGGGARGARGSRGSQSKSVSQTIPLEPEPKADDPTGAARFASKVGPYDLEALRGTLSATIDSRQVELDLSGGR